MMYKVVRKRDFPNGVVVKTPCSHVGGAGWIPGQGTKIPHAAWYGQKKKKREREKEIMVILMVLSGRFIHDDFLYFSNF